MSQELREGALLDHEKYQIIRVLGQGGFGITYLARDLGLDKYRAIKEFFPKEFCERDQTTSHITLGTSSNADVIEQMKRKFIKEARNIANLDQHQGIIRIHTVFEENNTAYYVMDYIEGEPLSTLVKRDGPLPEARAVKYIRQAGEALEYVHSHKVVHLDVKPANIMIRRKDDRPILIDFGLAKQYDQEGFQTSTTPTGLSHGYAPFEQYKAGGVKEFSPQTDVYSLAATLYFAVSGQVPPHAPDLFETELSFPYGFPLDLMNPIIKAMSTRRQDRPESMADFIESLKKAEEKDSEDTKIAAPVPVPEKPVQEAEATVVVTAEPAKPQVTQSERKTPISEQKSPIREPKTPIKEPKTREEAKASTPDPVAGEKKKPWMIWLIAAGTAAVAFAIVMAIFGRDDTQPMTADAAEEEVVVDTATEGAETNMIENFDFTDQLGPYKYTGEADSDFKPHGKGKAIWSSGEARSYDGEWNHGVMDGEAKYELRSGDTFAGTFKNGEYSKGRYTNAKTGEYFEGTFENGRPKSGHYYNKKGQEIYP